MRVRQAWAEYVWTRLRRMDYWNTPFVTNVPAKEYRWFAPGLRPGRPEANMKKLDPKLGTNEFSVRYYSRDRACRRPHRRFAQKRPRAPTPFLPWTRRTRHTTYATREKKNRRVACLRAHAPR